MVFFCGIKIENGGWRWSSKIYKTVLDFSNVFCYIKKQEVRYEKENNVGCCRHRSIADLLCGIFSSDVAIRLHRRR